MKDSRRVFAFSTPEDPTVRFERELAEAQDAVRSRQYLHSPHPRCEWCDVRLNRWTVHKPWCEA